MKTLTDIFYDLVEAGFIYSEPNEDGTDMSYGEYIAVMDYMHAHIEECLEHADTIEEALEIYKDVVTDADDDAKAFACINEDNEDIAWMFSEESYEDEDGYEQYVLTCSVNPEDLPFQRLKDLWYEYELEHQDALDMVA